MVVISRSRLQELDANTLRAELDARNVRLLQEQVAQLTDALARKETRDEKQAEALMEVQSPLLSISQVEICPSFCASSQFHDRSRSKG
jgi:hypothetical protein